MSKSANVLVAAVLLSSMLSALASASRVRFGPQQRQQQQQQQYQEQQHGRQLQVEGAETAYFSEMMLEGGPSVVVLDAGPFKFEASCVTPHEHTYTDYYMSSTTSPPSISTRATVTLQSDEERSDYNEYSYDYADYDHTEYFAGLRLTYTAPVDDYLYGSPTSNANYGEADSDILVGSYSAGDSRTQTVFAGRDGGYGDDSTLQSTSGYYATINGDMTIGIHKENAEYFPGGMAAFPDGYDCMIAGFSSEESRKNGGPQGLKAILV